MITAAQMRAARALLGIDQRELAERSRLSLPTIQRMPLVVEISVAFSVLIAFIVIGIFLFRIRERFDSVDLQALDRFRGERR